MNRCMAVMLLGGTLFMVGVAVGQQEKPKGMKASGQFIPTGNARLDLFSNLNGMVLQDSNPAGAIDDGPERKSSLLAGALSLAIPGAGEFYTKSYWRAGGFVIAEAGLWIFYAAYTSKGDKQTDLFQYFADEHWSVVVYADWVQRNSTQLNPDVTGVGSFLIPGTENRPTWERVNWAELNRIENLIAQKSGNGFTHQLPHRPEQQYYELIGKYPQFAAGWDDAGNMTPERILGNDVSPRFLDYSAMRGKANDFYNIATTGAVLLVVNHVLSALDAVWSAAQFNNRLKLEAHLQPTFRSPNFVEFVPTAKMTISF